MSKGKASISASGASMSKYDVEVEARLQALEKQAHPTPTGATQKKVDDRLAALEKAVADIAAKCDSRASGESSGGDAETLAKLVDVVKAVSPKAATNMGL
tara:strand:+ start:212 stop:511 length:300 start_codon:yes stop_codon:yes gene_type:complete